MDLSQLTYRVKSARAELDRLADAALQCHAELIASVGTVVDLPRYLFWTPTLSDTRERYFHGARAYPTFEAARAALARQQDNDEEILSDRLRGVAHNMRTLQAIITLLTAIGLPTDESYNAGTRQKPRFERRPTGWVTDLRARIAVDAKEREMRSYYAEEQRKLTDAIAEGERKQRAHAEAAEVAAQAREDVRAALAGKYGFDHAITAEELRLELLNASTDPNDTLVHRTEVGTDLHRLTSAFDGFLDEEDDDDDGY
jgi:hypothetical protein